MNRNLKITLNILVWSILLAYLIVAANYCSRKESGLRCTGLNVVVRDSAKLGFITPAVVRNILVGEGIALTGRPMDSINLIRVRQALVDRAYIKRARVYTSMDGKVNVEIEQRAPLLRVQSDNGYRFYVSSDGYILPVQRYFFVDVPVITGNPEFDFGRDFAGAIDGMATVEKKSSKNYIFLQNLINFVGFLNRDPFWNGQIVQINVLEGNEVELVPRVGNGIILLGELDNYEEKLDKLFRFYKRGLAYEGWNRYGYINIKFKDQVVCTK